MRIELDVIDPNVSCGDCGARCCSQMRSPPFVVFFTADDEVFEDISDAEDVIIYADVPEEARRVMHEGIMSDRADASPCSWLDQETALCRWYDHRPAVCRDFPVGGESCLGWRRK